MDEDLENNIQSSSETRGNKAEEDADSVMNEGNEKCSLNDGSRENKVIASEIRSAIGDIQDSSMAIEDACQISSPNVPAFGQLRIPSEMNLGTVLVDPNCIIHVVNPIESLEKQSTERETTMEAHEKDNEIEKVASSRRLEEIFNEDIGGCATSSGAKNGLNSAQDNDLTDIDPAEPSNALSAEDIILLKNFQNALTQLSHLQLSNLEILFTMIRNFQSCDNTLSAGYTETFHEILRILNSRESKSFTETELSKLAKVSQAKSILAEVKALKIDSRAKNNNKNQANDTVNSTNESTETSSERTNPVPNRNLTSDNQNVINLMVDVEMKSVTHESSARSTYPRDSLTQDGNEYQQILQESMDETPMKEDNQKAGMEEDQYSEIAVDETSKADKKGNIEDNIDDMQYYIDKERECFVHPLMEIGRRLWSSNQESQKYTKGCLWSPDGTCILVPVNDDGMHVLELPPDVYDPANVTKKRTLSILTTAVHVPESSTVYDFAWYPFMNSNSPETCAWIATRQHEPIQMWDAFTGDLRASYRGYNDVDEVEAAIAIIFSDDGSRIYGGYKKSIKIFDTATPGREISSIKSRAASSCFAINEDSPDFITAGTWNGLIQMFDLRADDRALVATLKGHSGGITWLRYISRSSYWGLFSGARKDSKIFEWDMRNLKKPIKEFYRQVSTNQRIYFDFSPYHQFLVTGDTRGKLLIHDLFDKNDCKEVSLHYDSCNGVNFHPTLPILATSAGQYHFLDNNSKTLESEVEEKVSVVYENSLLLSWYGPISKQDDSSN